MIRIWSAICACAASLAALSMTPADAASRSKSGEMVSWVVLASSHAEIDLDGLRRTLDAAFPGAFWPPADGKSFVVDGPAPGQFLIRSSVDGASGLFLMHNVPAPYMSFSSIVGAIKDSGLRRTALAHCCWLSIDLIKSVSDSEAYRFIGGALAQLAPDDAAILLHPSRGIVMTLDAANRRRLATGLQPD